VIADYTYDSLSRRTQLDLANGTQATYQYDQISRLTNLVNKVSATDAIISSFAYAYDKVGNRTSMTTTEGTHSYTYDKIYQLISVDYPDGYPFPDITYNFDAVGNRTSTVNGGTVNYTTNNMNQYTDVGGTAYTYDANGNLTSDGTNTYIYDYENRLIQVVTPTDTITFAYGPLGRRISKTDSTGTIRYIYDGDQVIMETDGTGTITATYAYGTGIDEVLTMTRGGSTYYYHLDGLGSVKEITDSIGSTVEKYKYDVYGQPAIFDGAGNSLTESAIGNSYMFTGRRYDSETGLYYYRARYYDPIKGRFTTRDPVGYLGGINLYSYVSNSPLNFTDPLGLKKIDQRKEEFANPSGIWFGFMVESGGELFVVGRHGARGVVWSASDPKVWAEIADQGWRFGPGLGGGGGVKFVVVTGVRNFCDFNKIKGGSFDFEVDIAGRLGSYLKGLKGTGKAVKTLEEHKELKKIAETIIKNRGAITSEPNIISIPTVGGGLQLWGGYKTTNVEVIRTGGHTP